MALTMVGTVFCVFFFTFLSKNCNSFCYVEKMIRSERLGLVKDIYSIQAMVLIRLLWSPGI